MKPTSLIQMIRLLALVAMAFLVASCTPSKTEQASSENKRPSLFGRKEVKCVDEVCVEPSFECVPLSGSVSSSLLHPPSGLYKIGPGDELDIEVAEDSETRATVKVLPDGMLYYNVADGINVKGKSIRQVSNMLSESLSYDYVDPIITVNVATADSQRFWILGEVKNPGTFPLSKPTTLIAALSRSQGLGTSSVGNDSEETVDLSRAILVRNGKRIPVDFEALVEDGDMKQNVYIHPNDYIYLPSRLKDSIYVLGQVNRPGRVLYDSDANVLAAIATAGGPNAEAITTKTMIIRGRTSEPEVCVVNLHNLMRGQTPNLKLQPGDIVWLPRSHWTNMRSYTETVLTTSAQAIAVQEGLAAFGSIGNTGVTITAGN